jgi:hypothetical protein
MVAFSQNLGVQPGKTGKPEPHWAYLGGTPGYGVPQIFKTLPDVETTHTA